MPPSSKRSSRVRAKKHDSTAVPTSTDEAANSRRQKTNVETGSTAARSTSVEVANDTAQRDIESNADISQEQNVETEIIDSRESLEAPAVDGGDIERM
jgi:hypothetical protein